MVSHDQRAPRRIRRRLARSPPTFDEVLCFPMPPFLKPVPVASGIKEKVDSTAIHGMTPFSAREQCTGNQWATNDVK